jgi:glycosyltransferase involved in cell wall biosynthesis
MNDQRLRILHVVPTYFPAVRYGGPIRSVHGLAAAQAALGHDVHVYTTSVDGAADLDVPLGTPVDLDGVEVHYFRVPMLRRLFWSPGLGAQLRRSVSSYDVVHLHSVFLWPTFAAARASARAHVPYLVAPRGMLVRDMIQRKSRWAKSLWINLVEKNSITRAAGIHVTAPLEAQEIRALFGSETPPMITIANGVEWPDAHLARSAGPFAALPPRYALFLSRMSWKKGLDRLIKAWAQVPDLILVIAGNDDEAYQPALQALAAECQVADRVLFVGPVSDEHKWGLYADAELFLLPSYSENFGNVVAEAMSMACPVIVSPEVGISALVQEAGAGIVTPCEPHDLAAAVQRLMSDPQLRRELGRRGQSVVQAQLTWSGIARRTDEVYRRIIAGGTKAGRLVTA